MGNFDWSSRRRIADGRREALDKRILKLSGEEKELALALKNEQLGGNGILLKIAGEYYGTTDKKPSD